MEQAKRFVALNFNLELNLNISGVIGVPQSVPDK